MKKSAPKKISVNSTNANQKKPLISPQNKKDKTSPERKNQLIEKSKELEKNMILKPKISQLTLKTPNPKGALLNSSNLKTEILKKPPPKSIKTIQKKPITKEKEEEKTVSSVSMVKNIQTNNKTTNTIKKIQISKEKEEEKTVLSVPMNNNIQTDNKILNDQTIHTNLPPLLLKKQPSEMIGIISSTTQKASFFSLFNPSQESPPSTDIDNTKVQQTNTLKKPRIKMEEITSLTVFDENYFPLEIEDILLGQGAFANVYKIRNKITNTAFALKIIEVVDEEQKLHIYSEILNEIKIMQKLKDFNCKNVISIERVFRKPRKNTKTDDILIISELCDCNLQEILEKRAENKLFYTENELIFYFKELLRTLERIHKEGIVHRDIKPRNLLYKKDDCQLLYADFGESKLIESFQNTDKEIGQHTLRGTPSFMSPEIFDLYINRIFFGEYDPFSSDYYSLGLCFLAMKTLEWQNKRSEIGKIIENLKKNQDLSSQLIVRLLEKDESKRKENSFKFCKEKSNIFDQQAVCPNEKEVLGIITLERENSKNEKDELSKLYMIASMYHKLSNLEKASQFINQILQNYNKYTLASDSEKKFLKVLLYKTYFLAGRVENDIKSKQISLGVNPFNSLAGIQNFEKAYEILTKDLIYIFSNKIYKNEYGDILNELGISYKNNGDNEKAIIYYQKSLELAIELSGPSSYNAAATYHNIGSLYYDMRVFSKAEEFFNKALEITRQQRKIRKMNKEEKDEDLAIVTKEYFKTLLAFGLSYLQDERYEEASEVFEEALQVGEGEDRYILEEELDECYTHKGNLEIKKGNYLKAIEYFKKKTAGFIINKKLFAENLFNMATAYFYLKDEVSWKKCLEEGIEIGKVNGFEQIEAVGYYNFGSFYFQNDDFENAQIFFLKSLKIYEEKNFDLQIIATLNYNLGVIALRKGDYSQTKIYLKNCLERFIFFYGTDNHPQVLNIKNILKKLI